MADSTVQEFDKLWKDTKGPKEKLESEWYLNVSFYQGDQWVFWNRGHIDQPKLADWRLKLVDNRIQPVAFGRVARKVKNRPIFSVTPNSLDEADLTGAEIGKFSLEDDWKNFNLDRKLFAALMWSEVVCAGFWKLSWDKTKGNYEEYVFGPDGQILLGQDERPIRASMFPPELIEAGGNHVQSVYEGNVKVDVLSPFHIYPDPIAEDIDDCEFIIEEHVRSEEYVKKHYNTEVKPDAQIATGVAESRHFNPGGGSGTATTGYKGVTLYELYGKQGSKWGSQGKRAVWTKDKVLLEDTLENSPYSGCPYVMFSGIKVPGRFWPTSVTSSLRGPQTELNKIKSQIRENALRIGNPALMKSRQANVHYSGVPGEEIYYDSTVQDAVPQYLQPPEMPVYVQQEIERIENSITEISGIHEVSKATVPSGVTAASAINLLQEADDTRLGPEIADMENRLGEAGTKILKLRAKFQDSQSILRMAGEDGEWDIRSFRGSMLKENTNVEVQAGSAMPRTVAAKQAAMHEMLSLMLQYGIDINPRDLRKFLRDYGVGGLEHMFASLSTDELQVRREHNIMKNGTAIDINDFDDDELHIEGHNEFRKGKVYSRLDDPIKAIIDAHVKAHQERRVETINAQLIPAEVPTPDPAANGVPA